MASNDTTTTKTIIPWVVKSRSNTLLIILVALALPPSELVLMLATCPKITAPTTNRMPTMTTPRTVPVNC